ncbi:hypothetical protein PA10_00106 [Pseudomonas phage pPa_SNUABM_DT01]|nr:hypothetical protein PA10_00106 [Pseudomonas phage pPa_SNUABM_DT01]
MELFDYYVEPVVNVETAFNHVALEAAIRLIESDSDVHPYNPSQRIDLRAMTHVESINALRELIHMSGFELDINKILCENNRLETPYERTIKKAFMTNHYMVESSKGWLVFDTHVDTHIEVYK